MNDTRLTASDLALLLTLMAEARPLRERADLKSAYGVSVSKAQRERLHSLDLIIIKSRPFALALSPNAWQKLATLEPAETASGRVALGTLFALLSAFNRLASRHGQTLPEFLAPATTPPSPGDRTGLAIKEGAFAEADEAIGRALQDAPLLEGALTRLKGEAAQNSPNLRRAELAAKLLIESVKHASFKRGLDLDGEPGSEIAHDPSRFFSDDPVRQGERVRIRKPPVTREFDGIKILIQPGKVDALT